mmetsp:Transcript_34576/g.76851  ORF Transcript_34576/g.76851 Transcript_34576/m.76851 type:complete len:89 (+) Transcript_34576:939-1205(+)
MMHGSKVLHVHVHVACSLSVVRPCEGWWIPKREQIEGGCMMSFALACETFGGDASRQLAPHGKLMETHACTSISYKLVLFWLWAAALL